jgi:iron complex transport system ATP-binding protein
MAGLEHIIEVKGLTFAYGDNKVLSDVALSIANQQFTVILGQNGSGKSTLMRILAGLVPYHYGTVRINQTEIRDMKARLRARSIGFLAQKHKAVFPFKVEDVVLTGRAANIAYLPSKIDIRESRKAMEMTGIDHLRERFYTELSGGEQQLVMIARTLAQEPGIILFDEPVSHLDFNNQVSIMGMIRNLVKEGITIVAALHDPNLAFHFGDRFIIIHDHHVHEINNEKPWEDKLVREIFHEDIGIMEYEGKGLFFPKRT